ncbi:MAG: helix-turn-helix domain-containing protein [Hydrogenophaga sp.]|uniref:helix-turn-helix domain-containing protein n=1 Tax=Hydrogenophaga sp. TaxID=1904254 RepID=UPI0027166988|nr:helix-turn-helix domain-containing protein [Hydrogenophaga sp.]MDO9568047.1 helix-turn-helix domain-containing protein [Hydrogenophaga sp.]
MPDFSLALPEEVCAELGRRVRARRLALNLSAEELAARAGVADRTLRRLEQTGFSTLATFVRVLEVLNALPDLQEVLALQPRSIKAMRAQAQAAPRMRAGRRRGPTLPEGAP